jgi:hypothetical protein
LIDFSRRRRTSNQIQLFRNPFFERRAPLLGESALQAAMSEGRAISLIPAVHYALSETSDDGMRRDGSRHGQGSKCKPRL